MKPPKRKLMVNGGFALALTILVAISVLSYRNMTSMIISNRQEAHLQVEIRELGAFLLALMDVDSMYRGYVITGNEVFLERYTNALRLIDVRLERLRSLAREDIRQQKRVDALALLTRDKLAIVQEAIDARRTKSLEAAIQSVMTGRGKRVMDEIQAVVTEAQNYEENFLQERQAREQATAREVLLLFITGSILSLALLCTVFLLLKSEIARRAATEEELQRHRDHLDGLVRERTAQFEQAKMAAEAANLAKTDFLENMSHEMRTPLTGIMGVIDLLLMDCRVEEHRRYMEMARRSAESLRQLIDDILEFARQATGEISFTRQPFDLRKCIDSATDAFKLEADRRGLRFLVKIDGRVPEIIVSDEGRLRQVLVNLVGNAVKFTEEGEIEVTVSTVRPENDAVLFVVRDTGIGINAEDLKNIFEKFAQADASSTKRFRGVGLGLAFSRQIIKNLGGTMWVESRHGEGSNFSFTLPLPP